MGLIIRRLSIGLVGFGLAFMVLAGTMAHAAEVEGETPEESETQEKSETQEESEKTGPGPTVVEIPVLLIPITSKDGLLRAYAYLVVQLEIPRPNDRWTVEEKVPFLMDLFVRELYGQMNTMENDADTIDIEGIKARLLTRVQDFFGDDRVGSVLVKDLASQMR